ncbi:MAG: crotonase/enoyl-CoA hydratase family protein [Deltaproteobacteria bacterium]|nr:crotonase/enoyl-CoA hydratase family protein [Deltaproteobacteria bacterium]
MPNTIQTDLSERIFTITLHRPERMNAFTLEMADELIAAFDEADANDDVRAVIVTGSGKAFCAGADLGMGGNSFNSAGRDTLETHRDSGGRVTLRIFESRKPVIGAINGAAVGVGATMTLPMDVRLASRDARFGFVFARRGLVPEACSSWFLPRIAGIAQAMEWVATGRVFPAQEALDGKLVSRLYDAPDLIPAARMLARECADNTSAVSIAVSRQLLWRMMGASHPMEAHRIDSKCIFHMGQTADVAEGVTSFLQKRPPNFPLKVSRDMPPFYPWWKDEPFRP